MAKTNAKGAAQEGARAAEGATSKASTSKPRNGSTKAKNGSGASRSGPGKAKAGKGRAGKGTSTTAEVSTPETTATPEAKAPTTAATPEPVVPAARTAPESRPLAVRHPRKPAPGPARPEDVSTVTAPDDATGGDLATTATSTSDDLTRLAMVPVDVARRVLPEHRLPFYLGVGALAVVGVVEWPLAVGATLAWEALRRRPTR